MTTYDNHGYTDHHRSSKTWDQPQPQDRPTTGADLIKALQYQTPAVQEAVIEWASAQTVAPALSTLNARIARERKNHPVVVGALVSA